MSRRVTRRDFLRASALGMGAVVVSTGLAGCGGSSSSRRGGQARQVAFQHGVASGDPLQDRVLLWTRVTPEDGNTSDIEVGWEVATDAGFADVIHSGTAQATLQHDFTLKVDVLDLLAGSTYYYRFRAEGLHSPVGTTRTLPVGAVSQVKFAVVSCSNYPAGYFHVYGEVAREENLDAVLHLGDYLYEYDNQGYATGDAEAMGRLLPPENDVELVELADYRGRYAVYRTDPNLQAVHAAAPFIAVWDDHEIANDTWRDGAENHDDAEQGDFLERKLKALHAYFEWMPIRPATPDNQDIIYRSFDFGDLVSLHMLDTRVIGRDEQIDYNDYLLPAGGINYGAFQGALSDGNRTMLGDDQYAWLRNQMSNSSATWQVLGQQVLMGEIHMPGEMLQGVLARDPALVSLIAELTEIKMRMLMGQPVTPEESARFMFPLPYNLDAWDGYAIERDRLLRHARSLNTNLVVLAGDTHNSWASNLVIDQTSHVGVEFATASVSSPGLEEYLQLPAPFVPQAEQAITVLVDNLQYLNANQRGYMVVTFTPDEARADWHYVTTVKEAEYGMDSSRARTHRVQVGANAIMQPL